MANPLVKRKAFYTKPGHTMPFSYMHSNQNNEVRPECILAEKVVNECFIAECPILVRFQIDPGIIEDCQVLSTDIIDVQIPEEDIVQITFQFTVRIEFDGMEEVETFNFTKRIQLQGADPDAFDAGVLFVVPFSFAQCLNCQILDDDLVECEIGLFSLVKLTAFVQLEVEARFCPMPPECVQVSPIGCPEFLERAAAGDFLPPRPEQFFPPNNNNNNTATLGSQSLEDTEAARPAQVATRAIRPTQTQNGPAVATPADEQ